MANELFELSVSRLIDAPPAEVWHAWTTRMAEWWAPTPWTTEVVARDLRAGGRSAMIMRGPNGEEEPMEGVFLEVTPQRIVSTDAFRAGWIPQTAFMLGIWEFEEQDGKTHYRASARHWSAEALEQHRAMGFEQGWNQVSEQLAALVEAR